MARIALLGAGIFAKEEHLPAIEASEDLQLVAVYSRSQKSAESLAAAATKSKPDVYYDSPAGGRTLDDLLARSDVDAVAVCLPILNQPAVVRKALAAGKHVLSEKPIAADVAGAKALIADYQKLKAPGPIWSVAENFRFTHSLRVAAERVRAVGGKVVTFHLKMYKLVAPDDKYFNTEWRKVPQYQGGFLLDGGVHFVAALRLLLGALDEHVQRLAGFSNLLVEALPPVDTVHAVAATQTGAAGTVCISFGTEFKSGLEVEIVTTNGAVVWTQTEVTVVRKGKDGAKTVEKENFEYDSGVTPEFAAFGKSLKAGVANPLLSPEEALKDIEIVQGLLESGEAGAQLKTLTG
ncbi:hypothetical protein VTK73DRAFT_566 [Phialemonium thermophilum]|uniref:NAD(P)-binding protein n=1 Tax=Phialemonium thermophilum TaxID=223376 RepID=A0ABR3XE83_9PEZI